MENGVKTRKLEYNVAVDIIGLLAGKPCKNVDYLRIQKYDKDAVYVIDSETFSSGVPYADYFKVNTRFCMTKVGSMKVRLIVHSTITFIQKTNFIIKSKL